MGSWDARDFPLWDSFCFWKKNIQTWRKRANLTIKHGISVLNISLPVLYTQFMQLFCRLVPPHGLLPSPMLTAQGFRFALAPFDCLTVLSGIRGSLEECMTGGGSDVFLWVENLHARDHSRICLGLKRIWEFFSVFGSYLRANFSFRVFIAISGSEKY